jgi:hypothetical protein
MLPRLYPVRLNESPIVDVTDLKDYLIRLLYSDDDFCIWK